jgi:hypothetical protein
MIRAELARWIDRWMEEEDEEMILGPSDGIIDPRFKVDIISNIHNGRGRRLQGRSPPGVQGCQVTTKSGYKSLEKLAFRRGVQELNDGKYHQVHNNVERRHGDYTATTRSIYARRTGLSSVRHGRDISLRIMFVMIRPVIQLLDRRSAQYSLTKELYPLLS